VTAPADADPPASIPAPFLPLGRHGATSDGARRLVIVGDVHGCFEELERLLAAVALAPEDLLISVGDLIDRGPESLAVLRFFRQRPNTLVLMGNHERKHVRAVFSYAQEISRLQLGADYGELVEWMRTLPYFYEDARVRVVHAALLPGVPLVEQRLELLAGTTTGERELEAVFPEGRWHEH
jgi:serine/threonine protein phosphatase 1